MATFAVINGLEGAQATGKTNKQRTVAAALAQQDIERLRAYPITSLSNFTQSRTVNVAGVSYTVSRRPSGYGLHRRPELHRPDRPGRLREDQLHGQVARRSCNPVKEVSLLTPAAGSLSDTNGTLAVKVTDRNGVARSGAAVTLTGPSNFSKATNSLGCAVFDYIPIGTYGVDVPGHGHVGRRRRPRPDGVGGRPARRASSRSRSSRPRRCRPCSRSPTEPLATWTSIRWRTPSSRAARRTSRWPPRPPRSTATGLFPFLDGFGVYAGTCQRNNPASGSRTTSRPPARAT